MLRFSVVYKIPYRRARAWPSALAKESCIQDLAMLCPRDQGHKSVTFIRFQKETYPGAQEAQTEPQSCFEQF